MGLYTRTLLLLTVVLSFGGFTSTNALCQPWTKVAHFSGYVNNVSFYDVNLGFVGMGAPPGGPLNCPAAIYKTTDGGITWTAAAIPSNCTGCVTKIFMTDQNNGWASYLPEASCTNSCLWRTVDGGSTWTTENVTGTASCVYQTPHAIVFTDLFGQGQASGDGGSTFTNSLAPGSNGIDFVDDLHGIATVYRGAQWLRTVDGGITWTPTGMDIESWSVYGAKNTSTFFAAPEGPTNGSAYQPKVIRSDDYGQTWTTVSDLPFVTTGTLVGIGLDELFIQVCGNCTQQFHGIYESTNQGVTWDTLGGPSVNGDTRFCVVGNGCAGGKSLFAFDLQGDLYKYDLTGSNFRGAFAGMHTILIPTATVGDTVSIPYSVDFSAGLNIDSLSRISSQLDFSFTFDDTLLTLDGISPPTGWRLSDLAINGDTVTFTLLRDTGSLGNPALLGYVKYNVIAKSPQTTSFQLTSIGLKGNWGSKHFCLTSGEGFFWGLRILAKSGVLADSRPASQVSIFPNPASGELFVKLYAAHAAQGQIEVYDLVGREVLPRRSIRVGATEAEPVRIDVSSLREGSYVVVFEQVGLRQAALFQKE